MSALDNDGTSRGISGSRRMKAFPTGPRLHRIADVMAQESLSPRAAAIRMSVTQSQVEREAHPSSDLPLTALYRWQAALRVPLGEMLCEPEDKLSSEVRFRSSLLKAMRTVRSIQESADSDAVRALSLQLAEQFTAMMPELCHVSSWPLFGQRRGSDEYGAIVALQISEDFFRHVEECD